MSLSSQAVFRKTIFCLYGLIAVLLLWSLSGASHAQTAAAEREIEAAYTAMQSAALVGPRTIPLGAQGNIKLPEGFAFVPKEAATRFMRALGNPVDSDFIGLIDSDQLEGFVSVDFSPTGYIKDDDARDWDVDELLDNLKKGTEQSNKERTKRGLPAVEVTGWVERPAYDTSSHRLVWSASLRDKAATTNDGQGVNYNTYVLGREGYLSLNLITDIESVEAEKPLAKELLAAVSFNTGKRYEDFNSATDHVAEYGLAALVGGAVAKKLGLLAVLIKFWKVIAIAALAFAGGAFKKIFGGKKKA
jgi:uncharacterized membrane-anchored protein